LSRSLVFRFSIISFIVNIAFFASYDLSESTSFTSSLITYNYNGFEEAKRGLWYNAILLIILHASNCFYQSPLFKPSSAYWYYFSAFCNGSSTGWYISDWSFATVVKLTVEVSTDCALDYVLA